MAHWTHACCIGCGWWSLCTSVLMPGLMGFGDKNDDGDYGDENPADYGPLVNPRALTAHATRCTVITTPSCAPVLELNSHRKHQNIKNMRANTSMVMWCMLRQQLLEGEVPLIVNLFCHYCCCKAFAH